MSPATAPPPKPAVWRKIVRTLWPETWLPITKVVVAITVLAALVAGVLFGITATEANPSTALDVIIAAQKPYGPHLNGWAVALAIAGWLLIPVLIGTGASLVAESTIRHIRASQQEAIDELRREVADLHRRVP